MKKHIKKILWEIRGGYEPKKFWDNWSKTFMNDLWQKEIHPQHAWIMNKIKADNPKSILEVGCGFGRNIKYLIECGIPADTITGIDISQKMISKAKNYVRSKKVCFKTSNILNMPFKDSQFDLTLSHGVLMHVRPQEVDGALDEMIRVSKKAMIIVEQNYGGNEYTFIHNYKKSLNKKGISIVEYKHSKKLGLDMIYVKVRK